MLRLGERVEISEARASSLDAVREMRRRLNFWRESWRANSLPMPSEAPVTMAQLLGGPKVRSCGGWKLLVQGDGGEVLRGREELTDVPGRTNRLKRRRMKLKSLDVRKRKPVRLKVERRTKEAIGPRPISMARNFLIQPSWKLEAPSMASRSWQELATGVVGDWGSFPRGVGR